MSGKFAVYQRKTIVEWLAAAGLVGIMVGASILLNGYSFGVSDHDEQLPQVRRMADSSYLARDWFVNNITAGGGVRNHFSWFMAWLGQYLSEAESFWLVYVFTFILMGLGIYVWAWQHRRSHAHALLVLFLAIFSYWGSLGSSRLMVTQLIMAFIAWAMLIWALVLVERNRWILAAVLLSGCVLIHPLLGLQGFALYFTWGLLRRKQLKARRWLGGVVVFVVLLALGASNAILRQVGTKVASDAQIVEIMAYMRSPWHYVPSTWSPEVFLQFFSLVAVVGLLVTWKWSGTSDAVPLLSLVGLVALGCLVGAFFTEVFPVAIIAKLQPFRMTILFQLLIALVLGGYCLTAWKKGGYSGRIISFAIIFILISASFLRRADPVFWVLLLVVIHRLQVQFFPNQRLSSVGALVAAVLVGWVGVIVWRSEDLRVFMAFGVLVVGMLGASLLDNEPKGSSRKYGMAAISVLVAVALIVWGHQLAFGDSMLPRQVRPLFGRLQGTMQYRNELDDIALWASEHTPADALFVVPPAYKAFRVKADRAIVVDFKSFAFDDEAMLEWLARLKGVVGRDELSLGNDWERELTEAYDTQPRESLLKAAESYGADFVVVPGDWTLPLELVYANDGYAVFRVTK
jgi:hypothetical protein